MQLQYMMTKRLYAVLVPVLAVAFMAAATLLSTQTYVRPDIGSVTFGFPLSWLSISHGFINAPPSWTVDSLALVGDLVTWSVVSLAMVYTWTNFRAKRGVTKLKEAVAKATG